MPIAQIANIAEQISTGDIKQTIDIKSKDETGMLAASFRKLVDYIQDLESVAMSIARNDLTVKCSRKISTRCIREFVQLYGGQSIHND